VDTNVNNDIVDTNVNIDIDDTNVNNDIDDTNVNNDIDDTNVNNDIDDTNVDIDDTNVNNDIDVADKAEIIEPVPPVLHLDDNEKFHDTDGNVLEIMTCGERHKDNIYFDMTDVAKAFEIPNLRKTLINKVSAYRRGIDYKVFITPKRSVINYDTRNATANETANEKANEKTTNKRTFLTLSGLIRVLHVSRNKNAEHYCTWVHNIVSTHQFGTQDQKEELAASVLGVSAKVIKAVCNSVSDQIPCIYLFTLGYVKDLRKSMQLSDIYGDDDIVAKYGFTGDLTRRTGEHMKKYGKIKKANLRLMHYTFIDPLYLSSAEKEISASVTNFKIRLDYENENELIVIPPNLEEELKEKYAGIGRKYVGYAFNQIERNKELQHEMEKKIAEFVSQLKQKDSEIDIIKRDTTIELNLLKAEIDKRDSTIEQNLLKTELENNVLKAVIENNMLKSELENNVLKAENKGLKTEMKMMALEQQLIEKNRIIENMNK
jgi:prophage antirepressor-like protein